MPEAQGPHRGALTLLLLKKRISPQRSSSHLGWPQRGLHSGAPEMSLISVKLMYNGPHRGALAAAAEAHLARKQCSLLRAGCRKLEGARGQQRAGQHFPAGRSHEVAGGRRH